MGNVEEVGGGDGPMSSDEKITYQAKSQLPPPAAAHLSSKFFLLFSLSNSYNHVVACSIAFPQAVTAINSTLDSLSPLSTSFPAPPRAS